jgi:hypothetical protein
MASSSGISRGSLTARWRSGRGHCSRRARQSLCRFCVEAEPKPCSKRQLQLADVNTRSSTELLKFSARLSAAVGWCRFLSRPGMPFEPEGRGFNSSRATMFPRRGCRLTARRGRQTHAPAEAYAPPPCPAADRLAERQSGSPPDDHHHRSDAMWEIVASRFPSRSHARHRWAALERLRPGGRRTFGVLGRRLARGLAIRRDWSPGHRRCVDHLLSLTARGLGEARHSPTACHGTLITETLRRYG